MLDQLVQAFVVLMSLKAHVHVYACHSTRVGAISAVAKTGEEQVCASRWSPHLRPNQQLTRLRAIQVEHASEATPSPGPKQETVVSDFLGEKTASRAGCGVLLAKLSLHWVRTWLLQF